MAATLAMQVAVSATSDLFTLRTPFLVNLSPDRYFAIAKAG